GYEDFLEIMSNAAHDSYEETRRWIGNDFDPRTADLTQ
ncbi:plasmid pRiA4b ORF-3 family protein, partial [Acidisoma sp. S159]